MTPTPVATGQDRASADGSRRISVRGLHGDRWRVRPFGSTAPDAFLAADVIMREWPVVCAAAPLTAAPDAGVTQILAERTPLLGVAATWDEHARRKGAKQRGRAGADDVPGVVVFPLRTSMQCVYSTR